MSDYDNTNSGALFNNSTGKREGRKDPDYKGSVNAAGSDYWVSGWINTSKAGAKYLALKLTPKETKPVEAPAFDERKNPAEAEFSDEIPFN